MKRNIIAKKAQLPKKGSKIITAKDLIRKEVDHILDYKKSFKEEEKKKRVWSLNCKVLDGMVNINDSTSPKKDRHFDKRMIFRRKNPKLKTNDNYTAQQLNYVMNEILEDGAVDNDIIKSPSELLYKDKSFYRHRKIKSIVNSNLIPNCDLILPQIKRPLKADLLFNKILEESNNKKDEIVLKQLMHLKVIENKYNYYLGESYEIILNHLIKTD